MHSLFLFTRLLGVRRVLALIVFLPAQIITEPFFFINVDSFVFFLTHGDAVSMVPLTTSYVLTLNPEHVFESVLCIV